MRIRALSWIVVGLALSGFAGPLRSAPDKRTSPERIAELVRQLGDDDFSRREAASRELDAIGEPALAALRTAATNADFEVQRRAELVIRSIAARVTKRELKKLHGSWELASYEADGRQIKGPDQTHIFKFDGEKWSIHIGGQLFQAGTVERIEPQEKMSAIDLRIMEGGYVGGTAVSIYRIEGDSLKYLNCGHPRAAEFATKAGDGRHYLTFRRAKR